MKFVWAILLFALAADAATIPTNSARIGNYPTATWGTTNYVLGTTETGSNGPAKLFQLPFQPHAISTNAFSNLKYATGWVQFTNACYTATNGDLVWLRSEQVGGKVVVPTNSLALLKDGVEYYIEPDLDFGIASDSATGNSRPLFTEFNDQPLTRGAYVWGPSFMTVSNLNATLVDLEIAGSKLYFQCRGMRRTATTSGSACVKQANNTTLILHVKGDMENWGYDGIWLNGSCEGMRTYARVDGRIYVEDTAIECAGGYDEGSPGIFYVGSIARRNTTANPGFLLGIGNNMILHCGSIGGGGVGGGTNWFIAFDNTFAPSTAVTPGILYCPSIKLDAAHAGNPHMFQNIGLASEPIRGKIVGARIDGPTNTSGAIFQLYHAQFQLENCDIIARNTSVTNSVIAFQPAFGTETLSLKNTTFNAPIESIFFPANYVKATLVTNVNNNISLVESVTSVFVRTLASSGSKSVILTNASRYIRGDSVLVKDASGTASGTNIIVKSATGNIDGVAGSTGKTISTDYGAFVFWVDGTNWWSR